MQNRRLSQQNGSPKSPTRSLQAHTIVACRPASPSVNLGEGPQVLLVPHCRQSFLHYAQDSAPSPRTTKGPPQKQL